ncbi:MAG TPA: prenyltransferase [Gammaproteobacteria bacterium]|nr:prenyltransferase [Gammaproteobacteria bacterium]
MKTATQMMGLLKTARPNFLILTPACLSIPFALASHELNTIPVGLVFLIVIGAIAAHIAVNAFNEYEDFRNGLDLMTQRTPFSGGSGALPQYPELVSWTGLLAVFSTLLLIAVGVSLLLEAGSPLLYVGLPGLAIVLTYSRWVVRSPWFCLVAPGLAFGPLMILGTGYVLTGAYTLHFFMMSLPCFFLVNNLLLLNQLPDTEPDSRVGRKTLPVVYGQRFSIRIYNVFMGLSYLSMAAAIFFSEVPPGAFLGAVSAPLALWIGLGLHRSLCRNQNLLPYLGLNVLTTLITPVAMAIGILVFS